MEIKYLPEFTDNYLSFETNPMVLVQFFGNNKQLMTAPS